MNTNIFIVLTLCLLQSCNNISHKETNKVAKDYFSLIREYQKKPSSINKKLFIDYTIGMSPEKVKFISDSLLEIGVLKSFDGIVFQYPLNLIKLGIQDASLSFDYEDNKLHQVSLSVLKRGNISQEELFNDVYELYNLKYKNINYAFYNGFNNTSQIQKQTHSWIRENVQVDISIYNHENYHKGTNIYYYDWSISLFNQQKDVSEAKDNIDKQIKDI